MNKIKWCVVTSQGGTETPIMNATTKEIAWHTDKNIMEGIAKGFGGKVVDSAEWLTNYYKQVN